MTRINGAALARLPGRALTAVAEVNGDFGGRAFPADERLELKVGAQVMFLRNDSGGDGRWVNGTIGEVVKISDTVTVEVDGEDYEVQPAVWERYKYSYSAATKTLSKDVVAEFTQFPLRLAWAVTIHKSQGKSYDRAIVDLGPRSFAPGPDLRRAQPHHRTRRALPDPPAASERHHRGRERDPIHVADDGSSGNCSDLGDSSCAPRAEFDTLTCCRFERRPP